jgi:hypothetical protein
MIRQETVTLTLNEAGGILAGILGLDPEVTTVELTPAKDDGSAMIRLTVTRDMSEVTE